MGKTGTAYFVNYPRVVSDLLTPHSLENEKPFQIVKTISLSAISYENFCTDMVADRQFLEDYADLCEEGEIWKCLFVHKHGSQSGVLVVPDKCYVKWAAFHQSQDSRVSSMALKRDQMKRVGSNIKASRSVLGYSQKAIADAAGISVSHYAQIEAGKRVPSLATFIGITEALKVSPDSLIYGEQIVTNQERVLQLLDGLSNDQLLKIDLILRSLTTPDE